MIKKLLIYVSILLTYQIVNAQKIYLENPNSLPIGSRIIKFKGNIEDTVSIPIKKEGNKYFVDLNGEEGEYTLISPPNLDYKFISNANSSFKLISTRKDWLDIRIEGDESQQIKDKWLEESKFFTIKKNLISDLMSMYDYGSEFYNACEKESNKLNDLERQKTETLRNSKIFSERYTYLMFNFKKIELGNTNNATSDFFTNILDFETLYKTANWEPILEHIIYSYHNENLNSLTKDLISNINKISNKNVKISLIDIFLVLSDKYNLIKEQKEILSFLLQEKNKDIRSTKIDSYLNRKRLEKGSIAPEITFQNNEKHDFSQKKYTIVLFYDSEYPPCFEMLDYMYNEYDKIKQDVEIISYNTNQSYPLVFPWKYNFIESKGKESEIFKKFYVYSFPSVFIINKNKEIVAEYLKTIELKNWINDNLKTP